MKLSCRVVKKFNYALRGLKIAITADNSFKIHFLFIIPVVISGIYLGFSRLEWIDITICIGLVLIAELFNTAIEYVVKMFTDEYHQLAEKLLDISAGAVLMSAFLSVLVAIFIYVPHIHGLLFN